MAWVWLLYYFILKEGGITHSQTVYGDGFGFDPFVLCTVEVDDELAGEMDASLIQEGAIVHMLCDLNDWLDNDVIDQPMLEEVVSFLEYPYVKRMLLAQKAGHLSAIPEFGEILQLLSVKHPVFPYEPYKKLLDTIVDRYVRGRWAAVLATAYNGHRR